MNQEQIVDYARPLINIEIYAKDIYKHLLNNDIAKASDVTLLLIAEGRFLQRVLEVVAEK